MSVQSCIIRQEIAENLNGELEQCEITSLKHCRECVQGKKVRECPECFINRDFYRLITIQEQIWEKNPPTLRYEIDPTLHIIPTYFLERME